MKYIILFFIFPMKSFAQIAEKLSEQGFEHKTINRIEYSNKKGNIFLTKKNRGDIKTMYLGFKGSNSVSIYLNDSLIFSKNINDSGNTYYGPSISLPIPFDPKKKEIIVIVLNEKKEYVKFKIEKKYHVIRVYFDPEKNYWLMTQNNNLPWE